MADPQTLSENNMQMRNMSENARQLVRNGKALTMNSNIKAYMDRVKQLNEDTKRKVLTIVKTHYHKQGKGNVWSEISREMSGGKRKTRKSKKASKKTRRHRKH